MSKNKTAPESRSATAKNRELPQSLGIHTTGNGRLYVKRMSDIDLDVPDGMIKTAFAARHNVQPT